MTSDATDGATDASLGAANLHDRAIELHRAGHLDEAVVCYQRTLEADSDRELAWRHLGSALCQAGRYAEGAAAFARYVEHAPAVTGAHVDLAHAYRAGGQTVAAIEAARQALSRDPRHGGMWLFVGELAQASGSADEAVAAYTSGIEAVRSDETQRRLLARLWYRRASLLAIAGELAAAAADCAALRALDPEYPYVAGLDIYLALMRCEWSGLDEHIASAVARVERNEPSLPPWIAIAAEDSPRTQMLAATHWVHAVCAVRASPLWAGEAYEHAKLRIAYVSADFGDHPVARALLGILEHHDRSRIESVGVGIGSDSPESMANGLPRAFDRFIDARSLSDLDVARWLRRAEIDVAIDLMGHTARARPGIFAARPAPVQASFLGYPGTIGAPFIDYLVADRVVVPESMSAFFSEAIAYLPRCVLPPPVKLPEVALRGRGEVGLPPTGCVFAAFHTPYKISREMFTVWMRILRRTPLSVLWLPGMAADVRARLRDCAAALEVDPSRLVFAERTPTVEGHLARLALADLFLDTLPYNAHTSASEALATGVPVLTCAGNSFAARIGASLLTTLGLPELIAESLPDYEDRAVALGLHPSARAALRARVACPARMEFGSDIVAYTRDLENLLGSLTPRPRP